MAASSVDDYLEVAPPAAGALIAELAPLRAAKDTVRLPLNGQVDNGLAQQLLAFLLARPARS